MPSVNSSSVPNVFDSSTVTTPSLPTLSIASAMTSPIEVSAAEMVATLAMSVLSSTSLACDLIDSTAAATAFSMPRLMPIGLAPAATLRMPIVTIAWASTVAVVVPSPATSLVFVATSLTSWAPMFSNGSSSSISLAIDTPSLVIVGAPNFLSSTTLRPFGPSVTLTVSASLLTPASSERRAWSSNLRMLCHVVSALTCRRWQVRRGWRGSSRSSPSIVTSVPPYFEYRTVSPTLMSSAKCLPSSSLQRPGPTARTEPCWGFSLAVSGMTRPDAVRFSASFGFTTIRSSSGFRFIGACLHWRVTVGSGRALALDQGECQS